MNESRCQLWGVLNVTPDSFSDGGNFLDPNAAFAQAKRLVSQGADVLDIGGQSSRPAGITYGSGAAPVATDVEASRVVPVVERVVGELGARVSVDTVNPEVAAKATQAGASVVNDVSCGASSALLEAVASSGAELVLMHSRDQGRVRPETTNYRDVVFDVRDELLDAANRAVAAGVPRSRIWIDPGLGFAKTPRQSIELLARLTELVKTGFPVLVGPSRKSFIAEVCEVAGGPTPSPLEREGGTASAVTAAVLAGARAVRVHDVSFMWQVVRVAEAMLGAGEKALS